MSIPYKNPITPLRVQGGLSIDPSLTFGNTFSVYNVGGFMEVYKLSDLIYTIPTGYTGNVEYSGNTIPIEFTKGNGNPWSPDVLTLASDNISSGRRRLGMLVYVYEEDQVYQFHISGYTSLFTAATASTNCVSISDFGTTVKNNTAAGQNFINAWTASTIEGISGYTNETAVWRKFNSGTSGTTSGSTGGSGTTNYVAKWTNTNTLGNSLIQDNGTTVSIGSPTTATAILEIASTSQGVLFPRMTQSQRLAISSPTSGLIVYQTDSPDGLYIYKVSGWVQII